MKVTVREVLVEDAPVLLEHLQAINSETTYLLRELEEVETSLEREVMFLRDIIGCPTSHLVVAEVGERIVGTAHVVQSGFIRERHKARIAIAVQREYWRKGIGSQLIEQLVRWAEKRSVLRLTLKVDRLNERAIRFYRRHGFSEEAVLRLDRIMSDGTFRDALVMSRQLGESARG